VLMRRGLRPFRPAARPLNPSSTRAGRP